MKQLLKISMAGALLCMIFLSTQSFAQGNKKPQKPRNFNLEKQLIGTWNNKSGQAFNFKLVFEAGNKGSLHSMGGELKGTYVVRGRRLIFRGALEGAPANSKKRVMKYQIVKLQGNVLALKSKNVTDTYTK